MKPAGAAHKASSPTTVQQLMLPGQTAAPEGPIDMIGMFLMHFAFRRDLDRFTLAVRHTPVDDTATWRALRARWAKFDHVLHDHHNLEDAELWPRLTAAAQAAADEGALAVVAEMEAEHAEIDPLLASIASGLDRLVVAADPDARRALEVRMTAGRDRLNQHMAHEERSALPLVQRYLTPEDWEAMEQAADKKPGDLAFVVPWILHDLPSHAMPRVSRFGGQALMVIWRMFRRSFERRERRAFGHVPVG
jgi:hypothetical protein